MRRPVRRGRASGAWPVRGMLEPVPPSAPWSLMAAGGLTAESAQARPGAVLSELAPCSDAGPVAPQDQLAFSRP